MAITHNPPLLSLYSLLQYFIQTFIRAFFNSRILPSSCSATIPKATSSFPVRLCGPMFVVEAGVVPQSHHLLVVSSTYSCPR
jgi:hypothetical protein